MKLKEIFYGIGIKPSHKEYGYDIREFSLEAEKKIVFAQWQHPAALRWNTQISEPRLNELKKILTEGDFAIDIGAHGGDYTVPLALITGEAGCVLAFEPNPYSFKVLAANAGLNPRVANIHPYMLAATSEDGDFTFGYSDRGFNNGGLHDGISKWKHAHFFELAVKGVNLTKFLTTHYNDKLPRLKYVKIDTEGNDEAVVRSLEPIIKNQAPVIRTEFYKHTPEPDRKRYLRYLQSLGYTTHLVESEEDIFGPEIREDQLGMWSHFDVLALPSGFQR